MNAVMSFVFKSETPLAVGGWRSFRRVAFQRLAHFSTLCLVFAAVLGLPLALISVSVHLWLGLGPAQTVAVLTTGGAAVVGVGFGVYTTISGRRSTVSTLHQQVAELENTVAAVAKQQQELGFVNQATQARVARYELDSKTNAEALGHRIDELSSKIMHMSDLAAEASTQPPLPPLSVLMFHGEQGAKQVAQGGAAGASWARFIIHYWPSEHHKELDWIQTGTRQVLGQLMPELDPITNLVLGKVVTEKAALEATRQRIDEIVKGYVTAAKVVEALQIVQTDDDPTQGSHLEGPGSNASTGM
jgi:hypothetical protein